jgi:hypothetical protein
MEFNATKYEQPEMHEIFFVLSDYSNISEIK